MGRRADALRLVLADTAAFQSNRFRRNIRLDRGQHHFHPGEIFKARSPAFPTDGGSVSASAVYVLTPSRKVRLAALWYAFRIINLKT